eukprot:675987-Rhodomonas_salina.5
MSTSTSANFVLRSTQCEKKKAIVRGGFLFQNYEVLAHPTAAVTNQTALPATECTCGEVLDLFGANSYLPCLQVGMWYFELLEMVCLPFATRV